MKFSDVQDALNRVDAATSKLAADVAVVVQKEAEQLAEIQALKDQLAAGTPVSQEQLDALAVRTQATAQALEATASTLDAIAKDPENPTPEEPPAGEGGEGSGGEGGEGGAGGEGGESGAGSEGSGAESAGAEGTVAEARDLSTAREADVSRKGGLKV